MRLYDISGGGISGPLSNFHINGENLSESSTAVFSPDDVYLALGTNDNTIRLWDIRYIDANGTPLLQLDHEPVKQTEESGEQTFFGIASKLCWVDSTYGFHMSRGIISGGSDGKLTVGASLENQMIRHLRRLCSIMGYSSVTGRCDQVLERTRKL